MLPSKLSVEDIQILPPEDPYWLALVHCVGHIDRGIKKGLSRREIAKSFIPLTEDNYHGARLQRRADKDNIRAIRRP